MVVHRVEQFNFESAMFDKGEKYAKSANKKGGEISTFFAPNLTMNLTYLCYGKLKCNPTRLKSTILSVKCTICR